MTREISIVNNQGEIVAMLRAGDDDGVAGAHFLGGIVARAA